MGVGDVDLWQTMVHRPQVMYRFAAMHHNDKSSFTSDEVYEKLEECVNGESLS